MKHRDPVVWSVVFAGLLAATSGAATAPRRTQQDTGPDPPPAVAFDASVELVTVSVSVLDQDGAPVPDLVSDDFRVVDGGVERRAAILLTPQSAPLDVALLVDLSASMRRRDWRDRAGDFLEALGPEDCSFLIGFSTVVGAGVWGRPDDAILRGALSDAAATGGTALFDALLIGLRELERSAVGGTLRGAVRGALNPALVDAAPIAARTGNPCPVATPPGSTVAAAERRKAVVVVSDGVDSSSVSTADAVLSAAELVGIPVFPIRLDAGERSSALDRLAVSTGGRSVGASDSGYAAILARLRGSYIVGFYTSSPRRPVSGSGADFTRHEISITLRRAGAEVTHPPAYFRPAIDTVAARRDVGEARRLAASGALDAAQLALDRAIRSDPGYAPAYFDRALARADSGRIAEAQRDASRAASLAPGSASFHELALRLSIDAVATEEAWQQAVRAHQAGADIDRYRAALEASGPPPPRFDEQLEAPRVMVARPYDATTNLLLETALSRVLREARRALAAQPFVGVVVDPSRAQYVMTITADQLSSSSPRRLVGDLVVASLAGEEVYRKRLLLEDVDDPQKVAATLTRFVADLEGKLRRP